MADELLKRPLSFGLYANILAGEKPERPLLPMPSARPEKLCRCGYMLNKDESLVRYSNGHRQEVYLFCARCQMYHCAELNKRYGARW